ncbi:MAG: ferredoxin [Actinomycetia bacterium]|nr:ferredoxin [Actinomycetes bacterium]
MSETHELGVDFAACDGHGLCAELLPERIGLDEWGYPVVRDAVVPGPLLAHARRAVAACPVLALRLRPAPDRTPTRQSGQPGQPGQSGRSASGQAAVHGLPPSG